MQLNVQNRTRPSTLLSQVSTPVYGSQTSGQNLWYIDALPAQASINNRDQKVISIVICKAAGLAQSRAAVAIMRADDDGVTKTVTCHLQRRVVIVCFFRRAGGDKAGLLVVVGLCNLHIPHPRILKMTEDAVKEA